MCLLKLGDKTDLYKDTAQYSRIKGAGFMHIVAVSGVQYRFFGKKRELISARKLGLFGLLALFLHMNFALLIGRIYVQIQV